jgi:hypothetical protein
MHRIQLIYQYLLNHKLVQGHGAFCEELDISFQNASLFFALKRVATAFCYQRVGYLKIPVEVESKKAVIH